MTQNFIFIHNHTSQPPLHHSFLSLALAVLSLVIPVFSCPAALQLKRPAATATTTKIVLLSNSIDWIGIPILIVHYARAEADQSFPQLAIDNFDGSSDSSPILDSPSRIAIFK